MLLFSLYLLFFLFCFNFVFWPKNIENTRYKHPLQWGMTNWILRKWPNEMKNWNYLYAAKVLAVLLFLLPIFRFPCVLQSHFAPVTQVSIALDAGTDVVAVVFKLHFTFLPLFIFICFLLLARIHIHTVHRTLGSSMSNNQIQPFAACTLYARYIAYDNIRSGEDLEENVCVRPKWKVKKI